MTPIHSSGIDYSPRSLTTIFNSTAIASSLTRIATQYGFLHSKKAFQYWYLYEGMEEQEFTDAIEEFNSMLSDYEAVSSVDVMISIVSTYL